MARTDSPPCSHSPLFLILSSRFPSFWPCCILINTLHICFEPFELSILPALSVKLGATRELATLSSFATLFNTITSSNTHIISRHLLRNAILLRALNSTHDLFDSTNENHSWNDCLTLSYSLQSWAAGSLKRKASHDKKNRVTHHQIPTCF